MAIIYLFVIELIKHYGFDKIKIGDHTAEVNRLMGKPDFIIHNVCMGPCDQIYTYTNWFTLGISEYAVEVDVGGDVLNKTEYVSP